MIVASTKKHVGAILLGLVPSLEADHLHAGSEYLSETLHPVQHPGMQRRVSSWVGRIDVRQEGCDPARAFGGQFLPIQCGRELAFDLGLLGRELADARLEGIPT